jgi:geranylgeranyl diphosphate synthase, type II
LKAAAIPGVAIPLLQDDCHDVTVDLDWIWEIIHLTSQDRTFRLDLDGLRDDVQQWFTTDAMNQIMGTATSDCERLAREWLAQDGKRWRPFLAVCVWKALQNDPEAMPDDDLRRIAIAVECFHKASLIHDDIEDADAERYGTPTLHTTHGVPIALNVGDLLLGEGYRLIGECTTEPARIAAMLRVAAAGHRTLCVGQGDELRWSRDPGPLSSSAVLEIFRKKTAPAFDVALQLGALLSGDFSLNAILSRFSTAMGIAYQIRDDLDDLIEDVVATRPTLPLALLYERTAGADEERALVEKAITGNIDAAEQAEVRRLMGHYEIPQRCRSLQESYKEEALRALAELKTPSLKGLLRRVVTKIFSLEVKGWCSEFEARNAAGGAAGPETPAGSHAAGR